MNELLLFIEIVIVFSMLLLSKRLLGKSGLFLWIGLASVIANIQITKSVDVLGISSALGNVMFASTFLATDILNECYGKKEANKGVYIGLFAVVIYLVCSQITLLYEPNNIDVAHNSMKTLFAIAPRICLSSLLMYFLANLVSVHVYDKLKNKSKGKKMWLRNNLVTISCNCLENFGFTFLAFVGIYSINDIIMIALSGCLIEIIIALCDTPFLYLAKNKVKEIENV